MNILTSFYILGVVINGIILLSLCIKDRFVGKPKVGFYLIVLPIITIASYWVWIILLLLIIFGNKKKY